MIDPKENKASIGYYGGDINLADQWKIRKFKPNWDNVHTLEDIKIFLKLFDATFFFYEGRETGQEKLIKDNPNLFKEFE